MLPYPLKEELCKNGKSHRYGLCSECREEAQKHEQERLKREAEREERHKKFQAILDSIFRK